MEEKWDSTKRVLGWDLVIRLQGKTKVRREDHLSPGTANTPGMGSTWALIKKTYFQPHLSFNKILSHYTGMWHANPMHPSPINNLLSVQDLTLLPPSVGSLTHIPTSHLSSLGLSHLSPLHPYFPLSVHVFCFLCLMPSAAWTSLGSQQELWWSRVEDKGLSRVGLSRVGLHGETHQTTQRATSTQTYANLVIFFLCKKTNKRRYYLPGGTWPWAAPRDLGCWAAGVRCWGTAGWGMGCSSNWWREGKWQGRAQRWVKSLRQNCKAQLSQHIQTWQFWTMKCKS